MTAPLDTFDSVAVTVLTPLLSLIEVLDSTSVTVGMPSLSMIVTVAGVTVSPLTVPPMRTVSFGSSTESSSGVKLRVAVALACFAAIVSVAPVAV